MPSLPPEMWHEILRHIPARLTYPKLLAVNRVIFHILMDRKWRNVKIITSARQVAVRIAHRLQDPAVAARVHSMNLDISLSREPLDDILVLLSSCMIHLVNISEFGSSIFTQGRPKPISVHLRPLFTDIWMSFGSKLRSLTLGAAVTQYEYFALDKSILSGLDRLHLSLDYASPAVSEDGLQKNLLMTTILPCLSSINSQLESFGLTFWGPVSDSSEFLAQTPSFPRLRSLSLVLPSNATSPSICHFLQHCLAGLQNLNLHFGHFSLGDLDMMEIANSLRHSQVQTLVIRPQFSAADSLRGVDALRKVVHAVRETVTSVVAGTDGWSTTEEFLPLFSALATCHSLIHLDIQINSLNTLILGKLAQSLPRLDSLVILHCMHYRSPQYSLEQESIFNALPTEDYSTWELKSLSLYRNTRTTPDRRLASAIHRRVPSIQRLFSGNV